MDDLLTNPAVIEAQAGEPGQFFCRQIAEFPAQIDASLLHHIPPAYICWLNEHAHRSDGRASDNLIYGGDREGKK
jgi:hypothetical protein